MKVIILSALFATTTIFAALCPEMDVNFYLDNKCKESFTTAGIEDQDVIEMEKEFELEINGMLEAHETCAKVEGWDAYGIIHCEDY